MYGKQEGDTAFLSIGNCIYCSNTQVKNRTECSAYRPISLPSIVSKLLEKHIHHLCLVIYLRRTHCPITNGDSRPVKEQVSALLTLTNEWSNTLDSGGQICAVFFDMKRAFHSVPHTPLIEKLLVCGLCAYLVRWITSYLTSRKQ